MAKKLPGLPGVCVDSFDGQDGTSKKPKLY